MSFSHPLHAHLRQRRGRRARAGVCAVLLGGVLLSITAAAGDPPAVARPGSDRSISGSSGYGFWGTVRPHGSAVRDTGPVSVGTRFHTRLRGTIAGIRFFRTPGDGEAHAARLWSRSGHVVARATFAARSSSGWQTAYFRNPVTVRSAAAYVVGYTSRSGVYFEGRRGLSPQNPLRRKALKSTAAGFRHGVGFPERAPASGRALVVDPIFHRIPRSHTARGFPNAHNTGFPAGTRLTAYRGPMVIRHDGTVISGKHIDGDLRIEARHVVVKNSFITGDVQTDSEDTGHSFVIKDSTVDAGRALGQDAYDGTGIGARNFVALRVDVYGGKRGINCYLRCTVRRSWVHDQATDVTGVTHESAVRMGSRSRIIGNTLLCNGPNVAPEAGCSADLTGYGDFAPVRHNLILHNLFLATPSGGTCAYGGSSGGKPYSEGARKVRFIDNVFQRGDNRSQYGTYICGYWATVMDFDRHAPGNRFAGNLFDDGARVRPY